MAVFLFTDLIDSSGLKLRIGDVEYATNVARPHNQIFRRLLSRFPNAREINSMGDGFFVLFNSVGDAVETALLFHYALSVYPWKGEPARTRIGIHLGEAVIFEGDDAADLATASHAADMCARLMSLGLGGQTLLTQHAFDDARQFVRTHPALPEGGEPPRLEWVAHGPYLFKGRDEPVGVFEIGAVGIAPLRPPPDAEKARRAIRPGEEETLGWRPARGIEIPGRPGWHLIERLGQGGFGEVWQAEHPVLRQLRVFKFCFDEERLRSFKRELTFFRLIRDALGNRDDIARLYDLKLDAPPFFLESEFAEHGNLAQWSERMGGLAAIPLAQRIEIVAGVADAVAAAHSIGILHKDIKPQNVLMQTREGGRPSPQLTDFGIGALADREALDAMEITAAGFTVNTLPTSSGGSSITRLYAPPEQLVGKPYTVQGDIYALGVMFYQIVSGDFTRVLAPGWERDVEDDLLRADIASCVDGDPARRLPSATELATRLRSLELRRLRMAEEREHARLADALATTRARAAAERERLRRTRRIALVVALLALAAIAAGFIAQKQKNHADAQRLIAVAAQQSEAAARQRAEAGEAAARAAETSARAAETSAKAARQKAMKAREAADELLRYMQFDLHEKLNPLGQINVLDALNARVRKYREEFPSEAGDLEAQREAGVALSQQGDLLLARGQLAEAMTSFEESLAIFEKLVAQDPANALWQRDFWSSNQKIGDVLRWQGKLQESLGRFRLCLDLAQGMLKKDPQAESALLAVGLTQQKLGEVYHDLGQASDSLKAYHESLTILRTGVQRLPDNFYWRLNLSTCAIKLGDFLREQGKLDEALALFREARTIREALLKGDPANPKLQSDLCWGYDRIGDVLAARGKFADALVEYAKNVAIRERMIQQDPENAGWARDLALGQGKIGDIALKEKSWGNAVMALTRELDLSRPWISRPGSEVTWITTFSHAAGSRWEALRDAPAGSISIDRAAALADIETALAALKKLKQAGHLLAPADSQLAWLEKLTQEARAGTEPGQ